MNETKKQWEKGFLLIELLVGMATITILTITIINCFSMITKMHRDFTEKLILQEHVRFVAESLLNDLSYANKVEIKDKEIIIFIGNSMQNQKMIVYELVGGIIKKDNQPITGGDKALDIVIKEFDCKQANENAISIKIKAYNQKKFSEFELETAVVTLNSAVKQKNTKEK